MRFKFKIILLRYEKGCFIFLYVFFICNIIINRMVVFVVKNKKSYVKILVFDYWV